VVYLILPAIGAIGTLNVTLHAGSWGSWVIGLRSTIYSVRTRPQYLSSRRTPPFNLRRTRMPPLNHHQVNLTVLRFTSLQSIYTRHCQRLPQRSQSLTSHDLSNFSTKGATSLAALADHPFIHSPKYSNSPFLLSVCTTPIHLSEGPLYIPLRRSPSRLRPWIQAITSTSWKCSPTRPS